MEMEGREKKLDLSYFCYMTFLIWKLEVKGNQFLKLKDLYCLYSLKILIQEPPLEKRLTTCAS